VGLGARSTSNMRIDSARRSDSGNSANDLRDTYIARSMMSMHVLCHDVLHSEDDLERLLWSNKSETTMSSSADETESITRTSCEGVSPLPFEYLPSPASSPTALFDESLKRTLFPSDGVDEPIGMNQVKRAEMRLRAAYRPPRGSVSATRILAPCVVRGRSVPSHRGDRNRLGITRKCYRD
jgi:hypothetical protein